MTRKVICALLLGLLLVCMNACDANSEHTISYEHADKIDTGMSYEEVTKILGSKGVSVGSGRVIYGWKLQNREEIFLVDFILGDNDKMVMFLGA